MSKFYGSIQGSRGAATRCGYSRIKTSAQSWDGSVITELSYNNDDQLMVDISIDEGSSAYGHRVWYGTMEEFVAQLKK